MILLHGTCGNIAIALILFPDTIPSNDFDINGTEYCNGSILKLIIYFYIVYTQLNF